MTTNTKMNMIINKETLATNRPNKFQPATFWWSITNQLINMRMENKYLCKEAFDALMAQLTPTMTTLSLPMASEQDFFMYGRVQLPYHSNAWYYEYAVYIAYYHNSAK